MIAWLYLWIACLSWYATYMMDQACVETNQRRFDIATFLMAASGVSATILFIHALILHL